MRPFSLVTIIVLVLFAVGCEKKAEPSNEYETISLSPKAAKIIESSNDFGIESFQWLNDAEAENKNLLISPFSVVQALSMVWNGAEGTTKEQMSDVLNISSAIEQQYNSEQKSLRNSLLGADDLVMVDIANSIWYRETDVVLDDFVNINQEFYNAEVSGLDFSKGEHAKAIINSWVNDKTRGKIPEIVDEVSDDHYMFLINAVYFLGDWAYAFDSEKTVEENFSAENGETVKADMMRTKAGFKHFLNNDVEMVELPYGNGHYNMLLMLPADNDVTSFIDGLDDSKLTGWIDEMITRDVQVVIPKFKFETSLKLNDMLIDMGMPLLFGGSANLSGINGRGGISVSRVKHKTFIEVDEKGTEAAAVASVEIGYTSSGTGQQVHSIRFDRPFVFAIREQDTNTILFLGKIADPTLVK